MIIEFYNKEALASPNKNCFETLGIKGGISSRKMGVNELETSTLRRNAVAKRVRKTGGHIKGNVDQVCCFLR